MRRPRLRDGNQLITHELYPLNEIPEELIRKCGASLVYLYYTGMDDIKGDNWGDVFAEAIGGIHFGKPIGIADVALNKLCWSMKTVKSSNPFNVTTVRLISGRCSPDFSYGITDPHEDVERTGKAVLSIWNERVNIANDHYAQVRTSVLVRSNDLKSYVIYEEDARRFRTTDYYWKVNERGNLEGYDSQNNHKFTWQPHGSQFTIIEKVPEGAMKFRLRLPDKRLNKTDILHELKFDNSWVTIVQDN